MFKAIAECDFHKLRTLGNHFYYMDEDIAALLCIDHVFGDIKASTGSMDDGHFLVRLFRNYAELLRKFVDDQLPSSHPRFRALFNFRVDRRQVVTLIPGTFLYKKYKISSKKALMGDSEVEISSEEFTATFKASLAARWFQRIESYFPYVQGLNSKYEPLSLVGSGISMLRE